MDMITRAQTGDSAARDGLLRHMQDRWYRFALANTNQPDMAMEVVQETALRVLGSLHDFSGQSAFSTWTLGIVLNVCRETKRKAAREQMRWRLRLAWFERSEPSQHDALQQAEHRDLLHRFVAELSDRQREVISLRYFEHCTTRQTAELMNVSEGTVKATLAQAIAQLRCKWSDLDE